MPLPILITAGATRNPIDRMRYVSARSSGQTGVALALALAPSRVVHVLGHPEVQARMEGRSREGNPTVEVYDSTRDLMARMERWVRAHPEGVVVHSCAVGDYETVPFEGKVESGREEWTVTFRPTPKIADQVKVWSPAIHLVTFKAAPPGTSMDDLVDIARRQALRTGSALVFANVLGRLEADVALVREEGERVFARRQDAIDALIAWVREASR